MKTNLIKNVLIAFASAAVVYLLAVCLKLGLGLAVAMPVVMLLALTDVFSLHTPAASAANI